MKKGAFLKKGREKDRKNGKYIKENAVFSIFW